MALAILVVLGVGLQVVVATMAGRRQAVRAAGAGGVAVGGDLGGAVETTVEGDADGRIA